MIDLTTKIDAVGSVVRIEPRGPVAPVASYGKTRGYLQDIYNEIQDLKRYRVTLVPMEHQGQPFSEEERRVSSRTLDNLSKIGLD